MFEYYTKYKLKEDEKIDQQNHKSFSYTIKCNIKYNYLYETEEEYDIKFIAPSFRCYKQASKIYNFIDTRVNRASCIDKKDFKIRIDQLKKEDKELKKDYPTVKTILLEDFYKSFIEMCKYVTSPNDRKIIKQLDNDILLNIIFEYMSNFYDAFCIFVIEDDELYDAIIYLLISIKGSLSYYELLSMDIDETVRLYNTCMKSLERKDEIIKIRSYLPRFIRQEKVL